MGGGAAPFLPHPISEGHDSAGRGDSGGGAREALPPRGEVRTGGRRGAAHGRDHDIAVSGLLQRVGPAAVSPENADLHFIQSRDVGPARMADRLDPIFNPRSTAIIGASRHRGKVGYMIMRNLITNEYQGKLFPVNPNADSVWGIKAYPSVLDVPDTVDLAIITI